MNLDSDIRFRKRFLMKYRNLVCAMLLGITLPASLALAQRTRTGTGGQKPASKPATPTATPTPAQQKQTATNPPAPGTLATVNGQAITLADLDPQVRQVVDEFDQNMPSLRKDALDARNNTRRVEHEAQKRKVTKV